jgi:hypothetical protein
MLPLQFPQVGLVGVLVTAKGVHVPEGVMIIWPLPDCIPAKSEVTVAKPAT